MLRLVAFGCLCLLFVPAPLWAGGGEEDFARARRLKQQADRAWSDQANLPVLWFDGGVLLKPRRSSVPDPLGRWRYRVADMRGGGVTDAFDDLRGVLANLEKTAGVASTFDPLAMVGSELWVLMGNRLFAIDRKTNKVRPLKPEQAKPFFLEPQRNRRRSPGGGSRTTAILFVNATNAPVRLVWHDFAGGHKTYGTLAPGQISRQHTFAGHVWTVEKASSRRIADYVAEDEPRIAYVDGTDAPSPKAQKTEAPRYAIEIEQHNPVLVDRKSNKRVALSDEGTAGDPFVARRHRWSLDQRYVMVMRESPAQQRRVTVVNSVPKRMFQPKVETYSYRKPGDRIARSRPHLFDVKKRRPIELPEELFATPWAIDHLSWSSDGKRFRFLYNQRGHQAMRLIELDAAKKTVRTIIDEPCTTFFDYSQKTFLEELPDKRAWIWMSERSGFNHLYLVDDNTGEAKPITSGDWVVRAVDRVDEDAGEIWFRAMAVYPDQDPYHVHHGRVKLDGTGLTWLTEGDGTHKVRFSPNRTLYIDTYSHAERPHVHELRRTDDGSLVAKLGEANAKALRKVIGRLPERFVAKGRDDKTDIWGLIYTPSNLDPEEAYPVIESIYAGPHGQFVPKAFRHWSHPRFLAELGFVVVQIDGMGTNWRSRAFHDVCWKNLGDSGFPDRIAWVKAAAQERPYMDLDRVGIFGGSAGGQSALRALLAHGDFYRAAVADCGCHDNRMDKIWWNEAWMGWPIGDHYEQQSNVTLAHKLEGKLLLTVGEIDKNVDPASTMKVVHALIEADKDFDLIVFPGKGHGAGGSAYGKRRMYDFFIRHLLDVQPRWKALK